MDGAMVMTRNSISARTQVVMYVNGSMMSRNGGRVAIFTDIGMRKQS